MKTYYIFLLVIISLSSCTSIHHGQVKKRYTQFGVTAPAGWNQKSFRGADLFYEHHSKRGAIFINAECGKVSDVPLEVLTSQLLVGFSDIKFLNQRLISIASREALISEISAKVDGVTRLLKTMVLRKNRCVYDAVFNSAPDSFDLATDFDQLVQSFWAEAEL
jgi:hypothetical protein